MFCPFNLKTYDIQVEIVGWSDRRDSIENGDDSIEPEDVLGTDLEINEN